jgi:nicotinate-nucleotide--dimethylbenzimidazole phosphoribosyltransferase
MVHIRPTNEAEMEAARQIWRKQILPPRGLGVLEDIAVQLAGILRTTTPIIRQMILIMFCADHGVAEEGVSALPRDLTRQLLELSNTNGTAIGILCRQHGIRFVPVDVGVKGKPGAAGVVIRRPLRKGTHNFMKQAAMSMEECRAAIQIGRNIVTEANVGSGTLVGIGEIGVGNTTSAAALMSALLGLDVDETVGRGSGITGNVLERKREIVAYALGRYLPKRNDPIDCMSKVGGFEIAAMVGGIIEAASRGCGVVIDGFTSTIAALIATRMAPVRPYLFFSHLSHELGHPRLIVELEARPLLNLDMGLGEGTGAALVMPILDSSAKLLCEMAVF